MLACLPARTKRLLDRTDRGNQNLNKNRKNSTKRFCKASMFTNAFPKTFAVFVLINTHQKLRVHMFVLRVHTVSHRKRMSDGKFFPSGPILGSVQSVFNYRIVVW